MVRMVCINKNYYYIHISHDSYWFVSDATNMYYILHRHIDKRYNAWLVEYGYTGSDVMYYWIQESTLNFVGIKSILENVHIASKI
jgi:hypothetical protein